MTSKDYVEHATDNFYDTFMVSFLSWISTAPVLIDHYYIVARILVVAVVVVFYFIYLFFKLCSVLSSCFQEFSGRNKKKQKNTGAISLSFTLFNGCCFY